MLRQAVRTLDLNVDDIVPSKEEMKLQEIQMQAQQQAQLGMEQAQQGGQAQAGGTPPNPQQGPALMDGAPVQNRFLPPGA